MTDRGPGAAALLRAARESARPPAEPSFGLPQTLPDPSLPGRRSKLPQTAGVRVLLAEAEPVEEPKPRMELGQLKAVIEALGLPHLDIPITDMADPLIARFPDMSNLRKGNIMARTRMIVLYDQSAAFGGLVVGTGNKTEALIGYTTLFGDSACAFNPIGDLYKSQVRQLSAAIGVPEAIIRKAPSADLWPGQTDESEVGFSYAEVDRILFRLVDRRRSPDEVVAERQGHEEHARQDDDARRDAALRTMVEWIFDRFREDVCRVRAAHDRGPVAHALDQVRAADCHLVLTARQGAAGASPLLRVARSGLRRALARSNGDRAARVGGDDLGSHVRIGFARKPADLDG